MDLSICHRVHLSAETANEFSDGQVVFIVLEVGEG